MRRQHLGKRGRRAVKQFSADAALTSQHHREIRQVNADTLGHHRQGQPVALPNLGKLGRYWIAHEASIDAPLTIVNMEYADFTTPFSACNRLFCVQREYDSLLLTIVKGWAW